MSALSEYYYDQQIRKYIVQFAAIFMGMQVSVGKRGDVEEHLIEVPIKFASADKVVAAIKSDNTQNKLTRLPMFACQLTNVDMAPQLRKGIGVVRRNTKMPTGGIFPDDFKVIEQRMPVPYIADFELVIFASNQDQHYQILEQILSIFDPTFQIQLSDEFLDWTSISSVELTNISFDENINPGGDRRLIQTILQFEVPIHISIPNKVHQRFVKDVFLRIGAVSASSQSSFDIIADLDSQDIPYDKVFSLKDIDLK